MRRLIEAEEAKRILSQVRIGYDVEELSILDAVGKVAAENVFSPINLPPFSRSLRDGYAVMSEDVFNATELNPVKLEVVGRINAGEDKRLRIEHGKAVEVATGAVMPENADSVVMVENTFQEGNTVFVKKAVSPKENVMLEGADIQQGELLLREGEVIDGIRAGLLAGVGIGTVRVKSMRIGIISTGDELVEPGKPLSPGKIYDVNSYTLYSEVRNLGAEPVLFGIVGDSMDELESSLTAAAEKCHAIVTSGSTSAGKGDLLYRIAESRGEMVFHGVRVKPGKPFFYAEFEGRPLFGLPGFPTSCLTIFREFVSDVIARNLGYQLKPKTLRGFVARRIYSEGRRELLPVFVAGNRIFPVEKGSGAITSLSEATAYLEIEEGEEIIEKGSEREVKIFGEVYDYVFGGLDVMDLIEVEGRVKRAYVKPELAALEFARKNFDAVFLRGDSFSVEYGFAGRDGKVGAVSGYGMEADFMARNHVQLINLLKAGAVDGAYLLKPFADKHGIEIEIVGEVGLGFRAIEELEEPIRRQIDLLTK
ncbi:molybdenum cofactor synthesis domain-containing protein [Geoglobus acetivorans]|uniref:Molybdopterin biosynthesis protein MoeA n=1 Tax=Geoglobus acetivorans TaxID=565033 RepID=A0A0A7GJD3_GEOAI|nr:Molybdopterin biosynthesis protein MoeA [Geoglobus acetivorans]